MAAFTESEIENLSLDELRGLGFYYIPGPSIAPDAEATQPFLVAESAAPYGEQPEKRSGYGAVVLKHTVEHAIKRLNPALPESARREALKAALSVYSPQLIDANEIFHKMLTEGIPVTIQKDGQERGERVWLVDFQNPGKQCFLRHKSVYRH